MIRRIFTGHLQAQSEIVEDLDDSSANLDNVLGLVVSRISEFIDAERTTLFLYDPESGELWSKVAEGSEKNDMKEIRVKLGYGIAGTVMKTGDTIFIPDAYSDPRFNRKIDEKSGFITRTIYCRPLTDPKGNRIGVIQILNKRSGDYTQRDEKLLDAMCSQAVVAIENAQLYQNVKKLNLTQQELYRELQDKQKILQDAFLKMEEGNNEMRNVMRRMRIVRWAVAIIISGFLIGAVMYSYHAGVSMESITQLVPQPQAAATSAYHQTYKILPLPVSSSIYLTGSLAPLRLVSLPAALDGKIVNIHFQYGEMVEKDQLLIELDTTTAEIKLRQAKAALIKAETRLNELRTWEQRSEVANAKRTLLKTQVALANQEQEVKESERLFGMGIIPATEFENAKQQLANFRMDSQAAQESLTFILEQANQDNVKIAEFEVKNAQLEVNEIEAQIAKAKIYAPLSGIVILPGTEFGESKDVKETRKELFPGQPINKGDVLLSIGNMTGLTVHSQVTEIDIHKVRQHQDVIITSDAFSGIKLQGKITYLSSQASKGERSPIFKLDVTIDQMTPEQRQVIRLGMNVSLEVEVYHREDAAMVPLQAVSVETGGNFVFKKVQENPEPLKTPVQTGITSLDAVEILSGVGVGDEIVY